MSGAINFMAISFIAYFYYNLKNKLIKYGDLFWRAGLLALLVGIMIYLFYELDSVLMPLISRFSEMVITGDDRRFYIFERAIDTFNESSLIAIFFGHGPGTFTMFKFLEDPIEGTSNNLYVDTLIETGILGISMIVYMFYKIVRISLKQGNSERSKFFSLIISAHLFISSQYRADYSSARFWIILLIIFIVIDSGKKKRELIVNRS